MATMTDNNTHKLANRDVPPPGSNAAKERGCLCPRIDNNHGAGCVYTDEDGNQLYWITEDCPLHSTIKQ